MHATALALSEVADPLHDSARGLSLVFPLVSPAVLRLSLAVFARSAAVIDWAIAVIVEPTAIHAR